MIIMVIVIIILHINVDMSELYKAQDNIRSWYVKSIGSQIHAESCMQSAHCLYNTCVHPPLLSFSSSIYGKKERKVIKSLL